MFLIWCRLWQAASGGTWAGGWHQSLWEVWRPDKLLHSGYVGGVWSQMLEGRPRESCCSPGGTKLLLGPGAGPNGGWERGGFSGCCIGRICIWRIWSPPWCSQRDSLLSITTVRFLAWGVGVSGVFLGVMEKSRRREVIAGMKMIKWNSQRQPWYGAGYHKNSFLSKIL